ncbi:MAG: ABC transporter ATP-binding protein [Candidatus Eremiobacterota bacterium]
MSEMLRNNTESIKEPVVIKITNLSKTYRLYNNPLDRLKEALHPFKKKYHTEFYALRDINFEVKKGATVGIIGKNGSGKSTLLKVITGILTPTEGDVKISGNISALLELGSGFNPEFTGIENIYFNGTIMGYRKEDIDKKLKAIISFADIGDFIKQPVKTYSSGMYIRLAFAVAINVDPDILIVDEALAVGDAAFQVKCINRIRRFKETGKTLIFVSHDPGAVKTLCNQAYLLDRGQIIDEGLPDKVFDCYNALLGLKDNKEYNEYKINSEKKEKLRKRTGNKKVIIKDILISNEKDINTDVFISGEKIKIKMQIYANEYIENPTLGILIRDRLGNDIFGTNTFIMNVNTGTFKKDKIYEVIYVLPLNLGVNIYNLTVAAHSYEAHINECYDWINQAVVFKVIPSIDFKFTGYCRIIPELEIKECEKYERKENLNTVNEDMHGACLSS